jgi:hypothetical protein
MDSNHRSPVRVPKGIWLNPRVIGRGSPLGRDPRDYGEGREPISKPGDFVMVLDGAGCPRFIWRTTEGLIKPLSQVDEKFAWDETIRASGGSLLIAGISLGKRRVKGSI